MCGTITVGTIDCVVLEPGRLDPWIQLSSCVPWYPVSFSLAKSLSGMNLFSYKFVVD